MLPVDRKCARPSFKSTHIKCLSMPNLIIIINMLTCLALEMGKGGCYPMCWPVATCLCVMFAADGRSCRSRRASKTWAQSSGTWRSASYLHGLSFTSAFGRESRALERWLGSSGQACLPYYSLNRIEPSKSTGKILGFVGTLNINILKSNKRAGYTRFDVYKERKLHKTLFIRAPYLIHLPRISVK